VAVGGSKGVTGRRSRPQRWKDAVTELVTLQEEYAQWLDTVPDQLRESPTAPAADTAALEATKSADLVLVPCQPSDFDLGAVGATVRLAEQVAGREAWVVMNAIPPTSKITEEAISVLITAGVQVAPIRLVRRLDFVNGLPAGQSAVEWHPNGKAAWEIAKLWEWTRAKIGMMENAHVGQ
jgi:chromosome partitioning protein